MLNEESKHSNTSAAFAARLNRQQELCGSIMIIRSKVCKGSRPEAAIFRVDFQRLHLEDPNDESALLKDMNRTEGWFESEAQQCPFDFSWRMSFNR